MRKLYFPERLISIRELADLTGDPLWLLYHHIDKGALHVVRCGNSLRVHPHEAQRYLGDTHTATTLVTANL